MSGNLGIIVGSSFKHSDYFTSNNYTKEIVNTQYGNVVVLAQRDIGVFVIQRHGADPDGAYHPPHTINKKAYISALKQCNCSDIIAFSSCGGLKTSYPIGSLVVPHDFICPEMITYFDDYQGHLKPGYDEELRAKVLASVTKHFSNVLNTGVYYQTTGPRFETAAEIRMYAEHADLVGMTSAHEAILAKELGIKYANVCMVDNMANGVVDTNSSTSVVEDYEAGVQKNRDHAVSIITKLIDEYKPGRTISAGGSDSDASTVVDTIIHGRWIVPVTPDNETTVLHNHSIIIKNKKIINIVPTSSVSSTYTSTNIVDVSADHVLMPGFINSHTHVGMTLLRGYSDDLPLLSWLQDDIWPAEGRYMPKDNSEESKKLAADYVKTSTYLAVAEMLRGGTTCFNDMYFHPDSTAEVLANTGFKGVVGMTVMDFGNPALADDYLHTGLEAYETYKSSENITFSFAPHAPYTVSDETLARCKDLSIKYNLPYHIHLHETSGEVEDSIALNGSSSCHKSTHPISPLDNLHRMNLLDDKVCAVHMTCLTDDHINILAEKKVNVVTCPYSNLKLASGFCPVGKLVEKGVNVALGTDSTASNNSLDMFAEMKLAACLSKAVKGDPTAIPAHIALRMATYNGAKTIGQADKTGSLEVGKYADIIAVKLHEFEHLPLCNVISHLVYSTNRNDVTDVWVNGKQLLAGKKLTTIDEQALKTKLFEWQNRIREDKAVADAAKQATKQ